MFSLYIFFYNNKEKDFIHVNSESAVYLVNILTTVVPTKRDSDKILCLQLFSKNTNLYTSIELTRINRLLVY